MSLAAWLGEDRECSVTVVGLDLVLGYLWCGGVHLIKRSCKRHFVSPLHCKLQRLY